jgi:hypothetical protein
MSTWTGINTIEERRWAAPGCVVTLPLGRNPATPYRHIKGDSFPDNERQRWYDMNGRFQMQGGKN